MLADLFESLELEVGTTKLCDAVHAGQTLTSAAERKDIRWMVVKKRTDAIENLRFLRTSMYQYFKVKKYYLQWWEDSGV